MAELLKKMSEIGGAPVAADVWSQLKVFASEFGASAILVVGNESVGNVVSLRPLYSSVSNVEALASAMNEFKADPAFVRALHHSGAFVFSEIENRAGPFGRLLETMVAGGEALIVPVGDGPNALGFVAFAGAKLDLSAFGRAILFIAAYAALTRAVGLNKQAGPLKSAANLSERERECLRWLSVGKGDGEIALILGISRRTVRFHIDNAKLKLGAATRIQAVAKALREHAFAA